MIISYKVSLAQFFEDKFSTERKLENSIGMIDSTMHSSRKMLKNNRDETSYAAVNRSVFIEIWNFSLLMKIQ